MSPTIFENVAYKLALEAAAVVTAKKQLKEPQYETLAHYWLGIISSLTISTDTYECLDVAEKPCFHWWLPKEVPEFSNETYWVCEWCGEIRDKVKVATILNGV